MAHAMRAVVEQDCCDEDSKPQLLILAESRAFALEFLVIFKFRQLIVEIIESFLEQMLIIKVEKGVSSPLHQYLNASSACFNRDA